MGSSVWQKLDCVLAHRVEWFVPAMEDPPPNLENIIVNLLLDRLLDLVEGLLVKMSRKRKLWNKESNHFKFIWKPRKNVNREI